MVYIEKRENQSVGRTTKDGWNYILGYLSSLLTIRKRKNKLWDVFVLMGI